MRRCWYKACDGAGIARAPLYEGTKHTLRTFLAGDGVGDRRLAQLFGHGGPRSVARYAKLQTRDLRSALARLPVVSR
jgi:hypothetical protein